MYNKFCTDIKLYGRYVYLTQKYIVGMLHKKRKENAFFSKFTNININKGVKIFQDLQRKAFRNNFYKTVYCGFR